MKKPTSSLTRYTIASVIGNGMEWYDFAIFGYFSPIFAEQFFPNSSPFVALINTFAVFAVGFLSRPLGAYFFGKLGDQQGRKKALLISILLMAISTSSMGLLPTYYSIGIAAPILLTVLRIFQGFSLGGEFTSSLSFLFEHSPLSRRGFTGAWIFSGGFLGSVLGALTGLLTTSLTTNEQLMAWGWRIPFFLGFSIALCGYYLRRKVEETPLFLELKKSQAIDPNPLKSLGKENLKQVFQVIGIFLPNTAWVYMFIFLTSYLKEVTGLNYSFSLLINLIPSALSLFLIPIAGYFSDIWGRKRILIIGQLLLTLFTPCACIIYSNGVFQDILSINILIICAFSLSYGPTAALLAEMFPTRLRNTGMAFSYHLVTGVFGGMTPLILTLLTSYLGFSFGTMLFMTTTCLIGLATTLKIRPLHADNTREAIPA